MSEMGMLQQLSSVRLHGVLLRRGECRSRLDHAFPNAYRWWQSPPDESISEETCQNAARYLGYSSVCCCVSAACHSRQQARNGRLKHHCRTHQVR